MFLMAGQQSGKAYQQYVVKNRQLNIHIKNLSTITASGEHRL